MSNDAGNFLRKMVKFVANPTTDWAELDAPGLDDRESEYAKAEIKAMIERKRRNDFVRKRELDMLRKIRREGLSQDSALALTSPSNLDSESSRTSSGAKSDIAVKAKIDAIEQQMVGGPDSRRTDGRADARMNGHTLTDAQAQAPTTPAALGNAYAPTRPLDGADALSARPVERDMSPLNLDISPEILAAARSQAPKMPQDGASGPKPSYSPMAPSGFANPFAVDVSEIVLDPDLDEAVIAFANADFEQCENSLVSLLQPGGVRHDNPESWMVLFDLYRALDVPQRFESLANAFAHQFGQSAPQWYSLPERVSLHLSNKAAKASAPPDGHTPPASSASDAGGVAHESMGSTKVLEGWIAPPILDAEAIGRLRCEILQLPRPWVMDWVGVESVTAEAANQLSSLLRQWSQDSLSITWIGAEHLFDTLSEQAPTGVRDSDPAFWMLRMELLRLSNRADKFDEVAIDYCVTYELSPPSWENARCAVRLMADATCTQTVSLSHIGDVSTSFVESQLHDDDIEFIQQATMELSGQLVGDIGDTLSELDQQLGASVSVQLDCNHLIRVDFIAAGDLLNWVLSRRAENRTITFLNPHRLVALFFGAMGITEHAKVKLQLF